jgi:hypothetical protein
MPRDILALLAYEAKRRPAIGQLVAEIDTLSEDEINAASVPLPWMRQALLLLKRNRAEAALAESVEPFVIEGVVPDPLGEMRRWEAPDRYVKVGRSYLEIKYGQMFWLDANGGWIDTIRLATVDPSLIQHSVSCGMVTRSVYNRAVRDRTQRLSPEPVRSPLAGVRFYRPG